MGLFGPSKKEKELLAKNEQLLAEIDELKNQLTPEQQNIILLKSTLSELEAKKESQESELSELNQKYQERSEEIKSQEAQILERKKQIFNLDDEILMQEFGIYRPTYKFKNSDLYKDKLADVRDRQKQSIKDGNACVGASNWQVNGSTAKGNKMVKDTQKLLLRAFNVECDDVINNVKISNFERSKERIYKSKEQISKLGTVMSISITDYYFKLKIEELSLALDFEQKKQEEKERIKEERERQREEAKAQKEIEEARKKLEKEQSHYKNALLALCEQLLKNPNNPDLLAKKKEIELNIVDTEKAIADVDYREANKRAGYVYIISNIGAFGEDVYKIGMTRRLDPMERVYELGDASVPFAFDVHALIFTDDAPGLESALHNDFEDKKVNKINTRREFFNVSLDEIKAEVRKNFDKTVEWTDFPDAEQYRQSLLMTKK